MGAAASRRRGVMKTIHQKSHIKIPADVTVEVKSRVVKVTGERGTLVRNFRHMDVDIKHNKDANTITVDKWFGKKKELSVIKTVLSHIENLFHRCDQGLQVQDEAGVRSLPCQRGRG